MSKLPSVLLPDGTITIEGHEIEYRSLSRSQAMKVHGYVGREDEAEDWIVACGTGVSMEEAHAWRDSVSLAVAGELIDAIITISGLVPEGADPKA